MALYSIVRGCRNWLSGVRQFQMSSYLAQKPAGRPDKELLKAVERELILVKKDLHKLPEVSSFSCMTEGAVATFSRTLGSEQVTVTLDTNNAVEMDMGGDFSESGIEDDVDSEENSATVPAFTITVSKPSGNKMQFECSFHPGVSDFEELSIMIDSVSIIPKEFKNAESIYSVESDQLGKDLYDGLDKYLARRGIDQKFGSELLSFYAMFDHSAYATNFLEKMQDYCSEQ